MRPLNRLGLHRRVVDVAEPAVERHRWRIRPCGLHQVQPLGERPDERRALHSEGIELSRAATGGHAEVEPPTAEPIDRGRDLCQLQGVVQRRDQHRHTEAQS